MGDCGEAALTVNHDGHISDPLPFLIRRSSVPGWIHEPKVPEERWIYDALGEQAEWCQRRVNFDPLAACHAGVSIHVPPTSGASPHHGCTMGVPGLGVASYPRANPRSTGSWHSRDQWIRLAAFAMEPATAKTTSSGLLLIHHVPTARTRTLGPYRAWTRQQTGLSQRIPDWHRCNDTCAHCCLLRSCMPRLNSASSLGQALVAPGADDPHRGRPRGRSRRSDVHDGSSASNQNFVPLG